MRVKLIDSTDDRLHKYIGEEGSLAIDTYTMFKGVQSHSIKQMIITSPDGINRLITIATKKHLYIYKLING